MPRHNAGGSGRKGPPRSSTGRSTSSSSSARKGKPFRKGARQSDSKKQYGAGKSSGSSFSKSSGAQKSAGFRSSRSTSAGKGLHASSSTPGKKNYGQKSRFARPAAGDGPKTTAAKSSPGVQKSSRPRTSRSTSAGKPGQTSSSESGKRTYGQKGRFGRASASDSPGSREAKFGKTERRGDVEQRGASFGKPYKKTFKSRPDRTSSGVHRRALKTDSVTKTDKIRLNKFIANSGISSRREADELIKMGLISVNGKVVSELGYKVSPVDEVRYEDKVLRAEKPVYILMNKPKGFITTTDDPQERKTVMHIVGSAVKERIYPVGRLDRNTTGLLLLTNDGDLADKLMHPSFNVRKVYKVELDRPLTKADFQAVVDGVRLEEGRAMVDDLAIVSEDGRTVGIELHIGWNRVVRRIFESLGYDVIKLDRTVYAGLDKKELTRGQWRFLSKEEIIHLKHFK